MDFELLFGGLILIAIGSVMLAAAAYLVSRTRAFLRTALTATGTVVGLVESSGSEGGVVYQPVITFATGSGQVIQFKDGVAANPPGFKPGDVVDVRYDPMAPQKARLASIGRLYYAPMLIGGIGTLLLVLGIVMSAGTAFL